MMPMRWHCGRSDISTAARSSLRLTTRGMDVLRWLSLERNGRHTTHIKTGPGGGGKSQREDGGGDSLPEPPPRCLSHQKR